MSRRTLALVFGGDSPEHDVSLVSARGIRDQLDLEKYDVVLVGVNRQGQPILGGEGLLEGALSRDEGLPVRWPVSPEDRTLRHELSGESVSAPIDVLFPIIHGRGGEDGAIQGVCALAGIACVGAGILGSALAMDKDRARRMLAAEGLPVVRDIVLDAGGGVAPALVDAIVATLGWPVFVKPARAGSSVGITRVDSAAALGEALDIAGAIDRKIVIEQAVREPRELEMAVLGNEEPEVAGLGEIVPHGEFYDYRAKYEDPESALIIPAPVSSERLDQISRLAIQAYRALDLSGMARVDFLLSAVDDTLVINEVNTLPGFTPISMYPKLWEAAGLPFTELLDRLIGLARVP